MLLPGARTGLWAAAAASCRATAAAAAAASQTTSASSTRLLAQPASPPWQQQQQQRRLQKTPRRALSTTPQCCSRMGRTAISIPPTVDLTIGEPVVHHDATTYLKIARRTITVQGPLGMGGQTEGGRKGE
jgi:hypothetical protein